MDHVAAEGEPGGGLVVALLAPVLQEHDELLQLVGAHGVGAQALDQPKEGHGAPAVQPLVPLFFMGVVSLAAVTIVNLT